MSTTPEQGFTFTEAPLPYGRTGVAISIRIDEILHDERSDYGRIQVFATPFFGRMLVIDGIIQTTEVDEFIYHEMLVLPPSLAFGRPASLLIIGGGDGGALRQAVKVSSLHRIIAVDIDPVVTEVSRRYLPTVSGGAFADPRVQLLHADGAQYVQECNERFDVVVLDLTDPVSGGPAEALFDEPFLRQVQRVLTPGGVMAMQCGSLVFQPDEVRRPTTDWPASSRQRACMQRWCRPTNWACSDSCWPATGSSPSPNNCSPPAPPSCAARYSSSPRTSSPPPHCSPQRTASDRVTRTGSGVAVLGP